MGLKLSFAGCIGLAAWHYWHLITGISKSGVGDGFSSSSSTTSKLPSIPRTFEQHEHFDCSKISDLPIVRTLGVGKKKTVFEVILPSGKYIAAKQCGHFKYETQQLILHEEHF
jgi:hypothetical protein